MITHGALMNYLAWCVGEYRIAEGAGSVVHSSVSADLAVTALWAPLVAGKPVVLSADVSGIAGLVKAWVYDGDFSVVKLTPTHLDALRHELEPRQARAGTRAFVIGGEALREDQLVWWRANAPGTRLINEYGPTETVVGCCVHDSTGSEVGPVPIGRPIAGIYAYVLDGSQQPVPIGVPGELYVGGAGLARGYRRQPAATAERFVPDALSNLPGARLYRTGDLVRYRPDGTLEFLGRRDSQVKLHGYRIELGEVETALRCCTGVMDAAVTLRNDDHDRAQLTAYVVGGVDSAAVREHLRTRLPEYMVPASWVSLEHLPLTPSGKVDRRRLPEPARRSVEPGAPPRTALEQTLVRIWSEVLRIPAVGIADDFFAMGGDSILSIQIVARARRLGIGLTVRQLFQHPTVEQLARVAVVSPVAHQQQDLDGTVPLTPIQRWFLDRRLPEENHYNQAIVIQIDKQVSEKALRCLFNAWMRQHDAVRLRVRRKGDGWEQFHADQSEKLPFTRVDLSNVQPQYQQAYAAATAYAQTSLNLETGPLARVVWFDRGQHTTAEVLLVVHHWATDGVSWRILLEDFHMGLAQSRRGESIDWGPKTTRFQQWARALEAYAQTPAIRNQLEYWIGQTRTGYGHIPLDLTAGADSAGSAARIPVALGTEETKVLLRAAPAAYRTETPEILLTALWFALRDWTGEPEWVVDVEGHGREEIGVPCDLSRTVGWFTSLYPVRLAIAGEPGPGEALVAVKELMRKIPNRGLGHGLLKYMCRDTAVRDRLSGGPPSQISFNYLGQWSMPEDGELRLPARSTGRLFSPRQPRSHLLEFSGLIVNGRLQMAFGYSRNRHRPQTISRVAGLFIYHLRCLIQHCLSPEAGRFTPSDFPEFSWSQAELDSVTAVVRSLDRGDR
jgi:non-ribosomal peptide synthase protein (TIGR01720 family)